MSRSTVLSPATRTYRGANVREVLAAVRREMGGGALILGTREIPAQNGSGARSVACVEVTVATEIKRDVRENPDRTRTDGVLEKPVARSQETVPSATPKHGALAAQSQTRDWLLQLGFSETIAGELVAQAVGSLLEYERGDTTAIEQSILDHVASQLPPGRPIAAVRGKRRTIAFVGPTGVGKTTTIAKLATTFQLELGVSTGLISVDPYRFAAAEQIRAYGEAIGTPVATVSNQDELSGALRSLGGVELVLVDTAGCPPKNRARLEEIAASLEILAPDEIHLVFAVNSSRHHLCESRSAFLSRVPLNRVLLTKMDEAGCMLSHLLEVLRGTDSPLSYWTTGQIVPDDIEPATPDRLARLMLAKERIDEAE